jgi:UDP-N-acetylglucosamine--N-acetylmuramyl-(pentapeptide) pyrophosphoryl-undecaprenol N-acetylglucosamine transferase
LIVLIGGYAAGPVALAGWASGVPIALLEPNRIAGFTQRLLGPLAKRIYVGFPESATSTKTRAFGIPLRAGFAPTAPRDRDRVRILVMGGSQGAAYLNDTLPEVLRSISEIEIVHQAGRGKIDGVRARYGASPAEVVEFLDDVPARLADADLVIARAGALTCAELAAVGRPAILVPFPFAADDHQWANAEALMRAGAAVAIRQSDASPERLRSEIVRLVTDRAARHAMADAARRRGVPGAANAIADDLLTLVEPAKGRFHVLGGAL